MRLGGRSTAVLSGLARQSSHHRFGRRHIETNRGTDDLVRRSHEHRKTWTRDHHLAGAVAHCQRAIAVDDHSAAMKIRGNAGYLSRRGRVLHIADRSDPSADSDRDDGRADSRPAAVADLAADEAEHALLERRAHCAGLAGPIDELVDDELAVLGDVQRAAIEEGQVRRAAPLGGDAIPEKDFPAWNQCPYCTAWRSPGRTRIGRPDRADDLLCHGAVVRHHHKSREGEA